MFRFAAEYARAENLCRCVLPHLRIKQEQCQAIIDLAEFKNVPKARTMAHWFVKSNPNWANKELLTTSEVMVALHYKNQRSVLQALANGTLIAVDRKRGPERPRFPRELVELIAKHIKSSGHGRRSLSPPDFLAGMDRLWETCRLLNKTGINGTGIFHKTGFYKPK